ncbi:O-antigen/teichoic acid export membrane protein [Breoghania corrubedonensis]|uniref:O-antigen/teichoic acid export membrane protein n=1 Tax=Breoghania corrubedonensis TaxID=665038 RepID=A0A2T5VG57_9HYPH|nr:hypothetical protein [Breoghania corrubedonensis]PTW62730.1 O-antigen/teichoic acid export membrane protein [Breoghania corrubedonensis]
MPTEPSSTGEKLQTRAVALFRRIRRSPLVANTISYTINFGLQLVIQLGFFMLISRTLGAHGYGVFVSITSVSIIAALVIGLGSEYLLVQRVAVDPKSFPVYFGHSLVMMALTFPLVGLPTLFFLHYLLGDAIALLPLCIISLSDLLFTRLVVLSANAYMAFDKAHRQLFINVFAAASKLVFLLAASLLVTGLTVEVWAWWFFASGAVSASVAIFFVIRDLGRPVLTIVREDLKLSGLYCLEFLSIGSMKDLDKPVVVHALGAAAGGQYAAGFRIIDAASAPVRAFLYATYTRHFRYAEAGRGSSIAFGLKLLPIATGLAIPVAIVLFVGADYIPLILGADFADTPGVVRTLALYPLLMGLSGVGADILRAVGLQTIRMSLLIVTSLALIPVVWFGATTGGLVGAALMRFALQVVLIIVTWAIVLRQKNQKA